MADKKGDGVDSDHYLQFKSVQLEVPVREGVVKERSKTRTNRYRASNKSPDSKKIRTRADIKAVRDKAIAESKKKLGRPKEFNKELGDLIIARLTDGAHYSDLIKEGLVNSYWNLSLWREQDPSFGAAVDRAQESRAERWADELVSLADDRTILPEDRRIMIDTRWKVVGSLLYRRYGVKQQVDINQTVNVAVTHATQLMELTRLAREKHGNMIDVTPTQVLKTSEGKE